METTVTDGVRGRWSGFEDVIAWQKARVLTREIYRVTREGDFARDRGLTDQIRRASVSIMSNVAEGYERRGPAAYARFLTIAKASCAETLSLAYVAHDVGYLDDTTFNAVRDRAVEIGKIIGGLRSAIEQKVEPKPKRTLQ